MKVVSPVAITLATALAAAGASAADGVDRDAGGRQQRRRAHQQQRGDGPVKNVARARRSKPLTIFHKAMVDNNVGRAEALLGKVEEARRGAGGAGGEGAGLKQRRRPDNMEKHTSVKREDIVKRSLDRRSLGKQREKDAAVSSAAAGTEVSSSEGVAAAGNKKYEQAPARASKASPAKAAASTRGAATTSFDAETKPLEYDRSSPFEFEEWDPSMATPPPATAPALVADDAGAEGRRKKLVTTKRRKGRRTAAEPLEEGVKEARRERRASGSPVGRTPNPRPRPSSAAAAVKKEKKKTRKGRRQRRRDLHEPASGKNKPGVYEERALKKSKKSSQSSSSSGSSSSSSEGDCEVRLINLTKRQWFSDVFWMVHDDDIEGGHLWEYGKRAYDDLALLAQDGDPDELIDFYEEFDEGVCDVDSVSVLLENGESTVFGISDGCDYFTMATSFIFSNDGFVSIDRGDIEDDAEWYLWGLDAGVEANTQLCWTVQAFSEDFPPNSACADINRNIADENDNDIPGEGYVYVHSGIHDFEDKRDIDDFLEFTCDDLDADSFAEYFWVLGFDDTWLLYDDDRERNFKDDDAFLEDLEEFDDLWENYRIFQIAIDAGSFNQFCKELDDINKFLYNAFEALEPQIFDFRTPMMKVEMKC